MMMRYFTQNFKLILFGFLIIFFGCSKKLTIHEKNFCFINNQLCGATTILNLNNDFTYYYETRIENHKAYSFGEYKLDGRKAVLNSKFGYLLKMQVIESFDPLLNDSIEIEIDSTIFNNSIICNLIVYSDLNDSTTFHIRRSQNQFYKIKFVPEQLLTSLKIDFNRNFSTSRIYFQNSNVNRFKINVEGPIDLYNFIVLESYEIKINSKCAKLSNPKVNLQVVNCK
jgi:hypothetical protein